MKLVAEVFVTRKAAVIVVCVVPLFLCMCTYVCRVFIVYQICDVDAWCGWCS